MSVTIFQHEDPTFVSVATICVSIVDKNSVPYYRITLKFKSGEDTKVKTIYRALRMNQHYVTDFMVSQIKKPLLDIGLNYSFDNYSDFTSHKSTRSLQMELGYVDLRPKPDVKVSEFYPEVERFELVYNKEINEWQNQSIVSFVERCDNRYVGNPMCFLTSPCNSEITPMPIEATPAESVKTINYPSTDLTDNRDPLTYFAQLDTLSEGYKDQKYWESAEANYLANERIIPMSGNCDYKYWTLAELRYEFESRALEDLTSGFAMGLLGEWSKSYMVRKLSEDDALLEKLNMKNLLVAFNRTHLPSGVSNYGAREYLSSLETAEDIENAINVPF